MKARGASACKLGGYRRRGAEGGSEGARGSQRGCSRESGVLEWTFLAGEHDTREQELFFFNPLASHRFPFVTVLTKQRRRKGSRMYLSAYHQHTLILLSKRKRTRGFIVNHKDPPWTEPMCPSKCKGCSGDVHLLSPNASQRSQLSNAQRVYISNDEQTGNALERLPFSHRRCQLTQV